MPKVSIICLCYNHAPYVEEALQSVLDQTYANIELIIVDDASTDGSKEIIRKFLKDHRNVKFIDLRENVGNCAAFNQAFNQSTGKYIVDFATDDLLIKDRIASQVEFLESLDEHIGIVYSDAILIDEKGRKLGRHALQYAPAEGDVYKEVIQRYFIAPPTMMIKRKVLEDLGGYDEGLDYEDFDFWVRSARKYHYRYQVGALTLIRKLPHSKSSNQYKKGSPRWKSTIKICQKIRQLNRSPEEDLALVERLKYELRMAAVHGCGQEFDWFYDLYLEYEKSPGFYGILRLFGKIGLNLSFLLPGYRAIRK